MTEDRNAHSFKHIMQRALLFRGLTQEEIREVLANIDGRIVMLDQGETYSAPGDRLTKVGIIIGGEILVSKILDNGEENLIQKLNRGYMVGADITFTTPQINPYYIYASEDTEVWSFPAENLMKVGIISEEIRRKLVDNLIHFLANENVRKQFKVDVLSQSGLRDRIMTYLTTRSQKLGTNEFYIPFDRQEMANYLCVNRSALSHELSLMREEGLIDFKKNYFLVKHVDKRQDMI